MKTTARESTGEERERTRGQDVVKQMKSDDGNRCNGTDAMKTMETRRKVSSHKDTFLDYFGLMLYSK